MRKALTVLGTRKQQGLAGLAQIGSEIGAPTFLAMLAEASWKLGRRDDALRAVDLGVGRAQERGQHFYSADLYRLRAEILLDIDGNAVEEAEALFGQSLGIARRQEAKSFELRTATSLARLWQRQGKRGRSPRPPRPGLRLVHRRPRPAGPEGREGVARGPAVDDRRSRGASSRSE
jgi:predicted ATPase